MVSAEPFRSEREQRGFSVAGAVPLLNFGGPVALLESKPVAHLGCQSMPSLDWHPGRVSIESFESG
jgi:hypothetical protein